MLVLFTALSSVPNTGPGTQQGLSRGVGYVSYMDPLWGQAAEAGRESFEPHFPVL